MTIIGSGTEFGIPYIETRWQGTATIAGSLIYNHSFGGTFDPALHAPVVPGIAYTTSISYRLVAGTAPTGQVIIRGSWRNSTGTFIVAAPVTVSAPAATIQRGAVVAVAPAGAAYCQPGMVIAVALNEVVDFTARFYAPNVEVGIGNAMPLLQRNVAEVIAGVGDLDDTALLNFTNGINAFTFSEQIDNANYFQQNVAVTANTTASPDGAVTADTVTENAVASTQHRVSRSLALTAGQEVTLSCYVKRGVGTRHFQLGLSGGGLVGRAYFDLGTGTVGATSNGTAAITLEANGFYRVSLTATPDTTVTHSIFFAMTSATTLSSETYSGDGVSSLILWGAQLNNGALLPYCPTAATAATGSGGGFVTTLYDQSNNGRHKVQATAVNQPSIIGNGAVNTYNGRPSLVFPTTGVIEVDFGAFLQPFSRSYVITRRDNANFGGNAHYISNFGSSPNTTEYGVAAGTMNMYAGGAPIPATVTPFVLNETAAFVSVYNNTVGSTLTKNGTVRTAPANGDGVLAGNGSRIGTLINTSGAVFGFSEYMLFQIALPPSDRTALQNNQMAYYRITP